MKVILSFYRDDERLAFERHRGHVPFNTERHNLMEIACKHLIEFMGIKQQAEKFGLSGFDLKLFRLEKIDRKAKNVSNKPYSYSQYWTGNILKWRLMPGNILKIICI